MRLDRLLAEEQLVGDLAVGLPVDDQAPTVAASRSATHTGLEVATVIWATGFGLDHALIDAPIFDANGAIAHERGVTRSPGLYFLGLPWQHTRGSALLGWVKDDAAHLAVQMITRTEGTHHRRTR